MLLLLNDDTYSHVNDEEEMTMTMMMESLLLVVSSLGKIHIITECNWVNYRAL